MMSVGRSQPSGTVRSVYTTEPVLPRGAQVFAHLRNVLHVLLVLLVELVRLVPAALHLAPQFLQVTEIRR